VPILIAPWQNTVETQPVLFFVSFSLTFFVFRVVANLSDLRRVKGPMGAMFLAVFRGKVFVYILFLQV